MRASRLAPGPVLSACPSAESSVFPEPSPSAHTPTVRVNETDTFDEERNENDDFFDFDDGALPPSCTVVNHSHTLPVPQRIFRSPS